MVFLLIKSFMGNYFVSLSVDYRDSLLYIKINIFILRCARVGHGG